MPPDNFEIRPATRADVPAIVRMLADDHLGSQRELAVEPLPEDYYQAFNAITADLNQMLLVSTLNGRVVGTLQLTFTPSLSYRGGWRATIESVRTDSSLRGQGLGTALVRYAIDAARGRGCTLVQLSTHHSRTDAQRFYERLGFYAGHVGMKLSLL
jgi:ribosomal protein S18 acetylase RimI-like enzyme